MRILTTNDMEQKLEYKKLTTEEHGESRKEKTFIKLLEKKLVFRDYPWWKTYNLKPYTLPVL